MSGDSDRDEDEEYCWIDPNALCPLSALRQLRELRMVYSFLPHIPPGVSTSAIWSTWSSTPCGTQNPWCCHP